MNYFGTDGIRGQFGQFPITPDFIMALGYVTGQVLVANNRYPLHKPSVVIGKDTRISGYVIEASLQAGFNAAGVDVYLLGPLPTPAISHLTCSFHASAGVVISASHNAYQDNGIKLFSAEGKKISDEMQTAINDKLKAYLSKKAEVASSVLASDNPSQLPMLMDIDSSDNLGKSYRVDDATGRYIEYCKGTFPYQLSLEGLTVVVDCANGAGYRAAPRVLRELGADVIAIHDVPNGTNINNQCGSTHPESLQQAVIDNKADVGVALDGDGDRIIMVDDKGNLINGDGILYLLATKTANKPKGVVGTLMTNMALELAFNQFNIGFTRSNVGDRYVMQELEKNQWLLGGETSGHILCLDKSRTGDALVAGLQVLALMVESDKALSVLMEGFSLLPQKLVNVRLSKMNDPYDYPELVKAFASAEETLKGRGRLLIRKSGTEPVIRVMIESDDEIECDVLANELAERVKEIMA